MKIGNLARKLTGADPSVSAEIAAARSAWRAIEDELATHVAEKTKLDDAIDSAQSEKERLAAKITAMQTEGDRHFLAGDSPEARKVVDDLTKLHNDVGMQDNVLRVSSAKLRAMEVADRHSAIQQRQADARRAFFRALRDYLLSQITDEMKQLLCDAQIASAQSGDQLNFGPFADRFIRTAESRATDPDVDARVRYAGRLLAEYRE